MCKMLRGLLLLLFAACFQISLGLPINSNSSIVNGERNDRNIVDDILNGITSVVSGLNSGRNPANPLHAVIPQIPIPGLPTLPTAPPTDSYRKPDSGPGTTNSGGIFHSLVAAASGLASGALGVVGLNLEPRPVFQPVGLAFPSIHHLSTTPRPTSSPLDELLKENKIKPPANANAYEDQYKFSKPNKRVKSENI